jgi:hypothetical protein
MTYISKKELRLLKSLLIELKKNNGYFPTLQFLKDNDPKPEILYSDYPGWNILKSRLPTPVSGFKRILEVHVFGNSPKSLYM